MSKIADVTLIPTVGPDQKLRSLKLSMEPAGICILNHQRYTDLTWCIVAHGHFRPCDAMVTMWYDGITCFIQANTGYTVKVNNIDGMNSKINISDGDAIQIKDCLNVSGQTNLQVTILYGKEQMTSTTTHGDVSARGNYMNTRSDNLEIDHNSTQQGTHMKGVFNLGMTCYANGIFQILAQTKRFLKTSIAPDMDRQPLTYFLERVLTDINQPGREKLYMTANKADVKKVLDIISQKSSFSRYRQHDCSELLMYILQRLKTENVGNTWMFEMKLQTVIEHKETKYDILHEDVCDTQLSFHLLVPLHRENHKMNPTVAGGVKKMLEDVESFTGEELPCRYCDMTNHAKNRMFKRLIVSKAPQILIIQIGRVENIDFEAKNYLRKQNILVEYEHSLSIAEVHWDESEKKMEEHYSYQLYGVVLHSGNIDCGHYYSYVKYQSSSEWFYCNDSSVTPIDENMVLNHEDAYLLFYDKNTE